MRWPGLAGQLWTKYARREHGVRAQQGAGGRSATTGHAGKLEPVCHVVETVIDLDPLPAYASAENAWMAPRDESPPWHLLIKKLA